MRVFPIKNIEKHSQNAQMQRLKHLMNVVNNKGFFQAQTRTRVLTHEDRLKLITRMASWGRGMLTRTIEEQQQDFLLAFKTSANIHLACVQSEVNRTTVTKWLNTDPTFKQLYQDARDDAVDILEAVARKRAVAGSDQLLMFLLKALRPDMYRDKASAKQWLRDEATRLAQEFNLDPAQVVAEAEQFLQETRH
jgi:hypothetical protein